MMKQARNRNLLSVEQLTMEKRLSALIQWKKYNLEDTKASPALNIDCANSGDKDVPNNFSSAAQIIRPFGYQKIRGFD